MEATVVIMEVELRSVGEMITEILQNEGIEAHLLGTSFLNTAYLSETGLLRSDSAGWRLVVPADQEDRARVIIAQLEAADGSSFSETFPPTD